MRRGALGQRDGGWASVERLDELANRAWPAERVEAVGPWRVRLNRGMTRRANSVLPVPVERGREAPVAVAPLLERVEALYRAEGLMPRFQLTPRAQPAELDELLAARGYVIEAPVSIQTAPLSLLVGGEALGGDATCTSRLCDDWFEVAGRRGRFAAQPGLFRELLGRLAGRAGFAAVRAAGRVVCTGLAVHEEDAVGVFGMRTLEAARRRGAARALLGGIARWARARGATHAYLQVEVDNAAAAALYRAVGFREAYGYHYRTLRSGPSGEE
jgi:ribosomal protein S18 acetylase RimI-like enzyme